MGAHCQLCRHKTIWGGCYDDCCVDGNRFEAAVTPETFTRKMIDIKNRFEDDNEVAHAAMDKAMCDILERFGYEPGIKVFKDIHKGWKE